MLTGYNHNIRFKNVLFHVQTEDKGVAHPVVITQLFVGGNVVATKRSTYEKFSRASNVVEIVLAIMQEQHKEMMKDLVEGRIRAAYQYLPGDQQKDLERAGRVDTFRPQPASPVDQGASASSSVPHAKPLVDAHLGTAREVKPHKVLDVDQLSAEKTLDELILEFLQQDNKKQPL